MVSINVLVENFVGIPLYIESLFKKMGSMMTLLSITESLLLITSANHSSLNSKSLLMMTGHPLCIM